MPVLTLTTDFGLRDFKVGVLKGTIIKNADDVNIIDISHNIQQYNISEAAFVVKNAFHCFPAGTAHLMTINDLDERLIKMIAAEYEKHFFLAFDNGILSMIFEKKPEAIYELSLPPQNGSSVPLSPTHRLAIAACKLAKKIPISELGHEITEIKSRVNLTPVVQESLIRGTVIYIDSFHNVIVNIKKELFQKVRGARDFSVIFRRDSINNISRGYHDVPPGEKLCLFNSQGYLKIAINSGKASSLLGLSVGDFIQIDFQ